MSKNQWVRDHQLLGHAKNRVIFVSHMTSAVGAFLLYGFLALDPQHDRALVVVGLITGIGCVASQFLKPKDGWKEQVFLAISSLILTAAHVFLVLNMPTLFSPPAIFSMTMIVTTSLVGTTRAGRIVTGIAMTTFVVSYFQHYGTGAFQNLSNSDAIYPLGVLFGFLLTCFVCNLSASAFRTGMIETASKLTEARAIAQSANDAKTIFLANMSHEIRTPMNGIMGMIDEVLDRDLDAHDRRDLEVANRAAQSLLGILNDILDFSKLQAGELSVEAVPTKTIEPFADVAALFTPAASAKGLSLSFETGSQLPPYVTLDPLRVRQILSNLVGNAVKFTNDGSIQLRLHYADQALEIEVRDTGIGIPENKLPMIFDRFGQAQSSIERHYGGTGLGLSISKQLVDAMNGSIRVESTIDQGTTFSITIPAQPCSQPQGSTEPQIVAEQEDEFETPLRILVAEDNRVNQLVLTRFFERLGHRATIVDDGDEAVELAGSVEFDVLIFDVGMERMDGITAARIIQDSGGKNADTHLLLATAYSERDLQNETDDVRINDILMKPLKFDDLRTALKRARPSGLAAVDADNSPRAVVEHG